jgi:hypothetical protein
MSGRPPSNNNLSQINPVITGVYILISYDFSSKVFSVRAKEDNGSSSVGDREICHGVTESCCECPPNIALRQTVSHSVAYA